MNFINLTPHTINIHTPAGVIDVAPSGDVARVSVTDVPAAPIAGIPVAKRVTGDVVGLPAPQDGVAYIVSGMVAAAVPGRPDVFSPGPLVRDDAGKPIGCNGLYAA